MQLSFRSIMMSLFLVFSLALGGCGSSSKNQGAGGDDAFASGDVPDEDTDLEINGDSDSRKAGGVSTVNFDFNSARLTGDTKSTLDSNASFLKSNSSITVQIEGHCDERGGVQYNLALGEKRAKAVKRYLVAMGVSSKRIKTISFGKERPVSFGHDETSWGQNRRANFVITAK